MPVTIHMSAIAAVFRKAIESESSGSAVISAESLTSTSYGIKEAISLRVDIFHSSLMITIT